MPGSNGANRRPQPSPWPPLRRPEMSCSAVSRVIGCATTGLLIRAGACRHLVELISWREVSVRAHDAVCTNDFHQAGQKPSRSPSSSGHGDCKLGLRRRSPAPAHRSRRQAVPSCRACRRDRESVIAHVQATVRGVAAMNAIWILTPGPIAERVTSTTSSTDDWTHRGGTQFRPDRFAAGLHHAIIDSRDHSSKLTRIKPSPSGNA